MSCMQCNLHKGGFKTESEFSQFDNLINGLVESGQLVDLGRKLDARFFEVRYQCSSCGKMWILSFPDQAYRGGWHEE